MLFCQEMCADTPSALYADINEAATNTSSQYAIRTARAPIVVEEEQKVDDYTTGPETCQQTDIYEVIKERPSKSLDFEEMKENTVN